MVQLRHNEKQSRSPKSRNSGEHRASGENQNRPLNRKPRDQHDVKSKFRQSPGKGKDISSYKKKSIVSKFKVKDKVEKVIKNKIQKPKHLKRKLVLTPETDIEARAKVLAEIQDFQQKKVMHSTTSSSKHASKNTVIDTEKKVLNSEIYNPNKTHEMNFDKESEKSISQTFPRTEHSPHSAGEEISASKNRRRGRKAMLSMEEKSDKVSPSDVVTKGSDNVITERSKEKKEVSNLKANISKEISTKKIVASPQKNKTPKVTPAENKKVTKIDSTSELKTASSSATLPLNEDSKVDADKAIESTTPEKRVRGKGRKGRKDTSEIVETDEAIEQEKLRAEATALENKKKERRCIGRKPLTDFIVGQSYTGKVVYVKPFGIFIDIGCHSDAFCHVSRLADDFVESAVQNFHEGDEVTARVVDVNRKEKKLTVSMQSESRINDELVSMNAKKERNQKHRAKRPESKKATTDDNLQESKLTPAKVVKPVEEPPKIAPIISKPIIESKRKIEDDNTPAALKRARKLARRAERRGETEIKITDNFQ